LGEEGAFTGAATVGGYPVFFKENSLHKIYGSRPENFRIQSLSCVGVAPGCEKSIAHLGNGVIYEGRDGFYFYDGSMPVKLSQDLEGKTYEGGIGGVLDSVYYVTVQEEGQEKVLTYDSKNRLWHRENGNGAKEYMAVNGVLYYRREDGLYAIGTEGGEAAEAQVQWEGVSGILREEEPDQGSLVGLKLRLSMEPGSSVSFYGEYDSSGSWEALGLIQGYRLHSREIPLRIRPCDHLRLKVKGRGDVTIHSLTLTMENAM
jgi:hypothetical protein